MEYIQAMKYEHQDNEHHGQCNDLSSTAVYYSIEGEGEGVKSFVYMH